MSGDLSALVARLEAVTSRLEAAADKAGGGEPAGLKVRWKHSVTSDGNFILERVFGTRSLDWVWLKDLTLNCRFGSYCWRVRPGKISDNCFLLEERIVRSWSFLLVVNLKF